MAFQVTGVHHVGITVRNIEQSLAWYARMFDVQPGSISHGSGQSLSDSLQVADADLSFAMVDVGSTRIELLQYHHPVGKDFDRSNGDVGSAHICFSVSSVAEAFRDLTDKGGIFNGPPVTLDSGAFAGSTWAYLRDPDGIQLEIWESPAG